jgi:hypothetical protein
LNLKTFSFPEDKHNKMAENILSQWGGLVKLTFSEQKVLFVALTHLLAEQHVHPSKKKRKRVQAQHINKETFRKRTKTLSNMSMTDTMMGIYSSLPIAANINTSLRHGCRHSHPPVACGFPKCEWKHNPVDVGAWKDHLNKSHYRQLLCPVSGCDFVLSVDDWSFQTFCNTYMLHHWSGDCIHSGVVP